MTDKVSLFPKLHRVQAHDLDMSRFHKRKTRRQTEVKTKDVCPCGTAAAITVNVALADDTSTSSIPTLKLPVTHCVKRSGRTKQNVEESGGWQGCCNKVFVDQGGPSKKQQRKRLSRSENLVSLWARVRDPSQEQREVWIGSQPSPRQSSGSSRACINCLLSGAFLGRSMTAAMMGALWPLL